MNKCPHCGSRNFSNLTKCVRCFSQVWAAPGYEQYVGLPPKTKEITAMSNEAIKARLIEAENNWNDMRSCSQPRDTNNIAEWGREYGVWLLSTVEKLLDDNRRLLEGKSLR